MTREEAIQKLDPGMIQAGDFVDALVALGLLKLDEPENTSRRRAIEAIEQELSGNRIARNNAAHSILQRLDAAGLQITEK